jgi:hypothetical protein
MAQKHVYSHTPSKACAYSRPSVKMSRCSKVTSHAIALGQCAGGRDAAGEKSKPTTS